MNRTILSILALLGNLALAQGQTRLPPPSASPSRVPPPVPTKSFSWQPVQKVLGPSGMEEGDRFQAAFPRTDLNVLVRGFPLDSAGILVSRFTFKRADPDAPKGTPIQMTAKLFLMDSEVPRAMAKALENGLEITGIYDPFLEESPSMKCLRLQGTGSRANLAWAAKMVLSATGTPFSSNTGNPGNNPNPNSSWGEVEDLFGQGDILGPILRYQGMGPRFQSPNGESCLFFQKDGKSMITLGEVLIPEGKKARLVGALTQRHIGVTALFTESWGEVRRDWLDFWAVGEGTQPAENLKEAFEEAFGPETQTQNQGNEARKEP